MCEKIQVAGALNATLASSADRDGIDDSNAVLRSDEPRTSDDKVVLRSDEPRTSDNEVPAKKRKTRRGKSKRQRNVHHHHHPYQKQDGKVVKAEAPYNSNRFLIEDHGELESIDAELQKGNATATRTRDSSDSVDSDGEFYSTPDDEEVFLIKDFDDQYESLQAERLRAMSKDELIHEYMLLESKLELLTKRLKVKQQTSPTALESRCEVAHKEIELQRLLCENEALKSENEALRAKIECNSDSADSETDSSDTSSSSLSSTDSHEDGVQPLVNGHAINNNNNEGSEQEQAV